MKRGELASAKTALKAEVPSIGRMLKKSFHPLADWYAEIASAGT
jgi:hypothetical protein